MAHTIGGKQAKVKKTKAKKSQIKKKPAAASKSDDKKSREDFRPVIKRAAMDIAGREGWAAATPAAIAVETHLSVSDVTKAYADIWQVLQDVMTDIAHSTEDTVRDYMTENWRDNLHEILMTRFDFAQEYRAALKTLPTFAARHPRHSAGMAKHLYESMQRMLELSGIEESHITPPAIAAFTLIYVSLIDRWGKDDTADMSPTMAAIDKRLGWFERALPYIGRMDCPAPVKDAAEKAAGKAKKAARKAKNRFKAASV